MTQLWSHANFDFSAVSVFVVGAVDNEFVDIRCDGAPVAGVPYGVFVSSPFPVDDQLGSLSKASIHVDVVNRDSEDTANYQR